MLADASIHLTGILLLAPHLTAENHRDLSPARNTAKREIERLVAELAPAPDVPARIQRLGPALKERPRASNTWAMLVESQAGVRASLGTTAARRRRAPPTTGTRR